MRGVCGRVEVNSETVDRLNRSVGALLDQREQETEALRGIAFTLLPAKGAITAANYGQGLGLVADAHRDLLAVLEVRGGPSDPAQDRSTGDSGRDLRDRL